MPTVPATAMFGLSGAAFAIPAGVRSGNTSGDFEPRSGNLGYLLIIRKRSPLPTCADQIDHNLLATNTNRRNS